MRYFYIKIQAGDSNSTFTIYYVNNISSNNIASKFDKSNNTTSLATGITYDELTTEEGILVEVPDNIIKITIDDELNNVCNTLEVATGPYAEINTTDVSCDFGSIIISGFTGGTSPYLINIGQYRASSTGDTITFDNVQNGLYQVLISDTNGNTYIKEITVGGTPLVAELQIITFPSTSTSSDGEIKLISSGGTYNKTYKLYKNTDFPNDVICGGTLVTTITNVTLSTFERTITGLTCGAYCFLVTDASSCEVNTELIEVCSTPVQPPVNYNIIRVRIGGTVESVCTAATSARLYSTNENDLVDGGYYVNLNGTPYEGGGAYFMNIGLYDCSYGTITNGYFSTVGTCSPCL